MWGTALVLAGVTVLVGVDVFWPSSPDLLARGPILVVGDSLVEQANQDLQTWNVPGAPVVVEDGPGSAPCDWAAGYVDPYTGRELLFSELLSAVHPSAVVFAFTGNPGLSGHPGCVDATTHYTLASLLDSYESTLIPMAVYAGEHGARVWFSASPPRNPATPPGSYMGNGGGLDYGFNGAGALNRLYRSMADSSLGRRLHWTYSTAAAQAVSSPALAWRATLACAPWDLPDCRDGQVRVRAGGLDSIHLDDEGAGAIRFAMGLVDPPLAAMGISSTPSWDGEEAHRG
ncbi:MAG: hypothetical protein ACLQRH_06140 [Acidimicrobiales bacterium]